jgi:hypothetical protein
MKRIGSCLLAFGLIGLMGASVARAADSMPFRQEFTPGSYCHMRFPAIRPSTLGTRHPTLKRANTGDQIDFYGPCDESPTGKDQVWHQKLDQEHRRLENY